MDPGLGLSVCVPFGATGTQVESALTARISKKPLPFDLRRMSKVEERKTGKRWTETTDETLIAYQSLRDQQRRWKRSLRVYWTHATRNPADEWMLLPLGRKQKKNRDSNLRCGSLAETERRKKIQ
jgi:hypothetical protein